MICKGQSSKDTTTCLPNKVVRALLKDALQKDILLDEVNNLNDRIKEKETQLSASTTRDSLLIVSLKKEIFQLEEQKTLLITQSDKLEKQLRKARRKARWVGIAGILTTGAAIFLLK